MERADRPCPRAASHRPTALLSGKTGLFSFCARGRADVCGYYSPKHGFLQLDFLQRKHLNRHCGRQRQADLDVADAEGLALLRSLRGRLPGHALPCFVRELPNGGGKRPVEAS